MTRIEAYHILHDMWKDANEKQREAIDIAQNDIEFVDLTPKQVLAQFSGHMTNADHIRSMSDEELENSIRVISLGYDPWCDHHCKMQGEDNCNNCLTKWLKQPYKENA